MIILRTVKNALTEVSFFLIKKNLLYEKLLVIQRLFTLG